MRIGSAELTRVAAIGIRCWALTRFRRPDPGMPSSRAKAYHMRAMDVIEAHPQSHMARPMMIATKCAKAELRFSYAMYRTGYGSFAVAAMSPRGMHQVSANSNT